MLRSILNKPVVNKQHYFTLYRTFKIFASSRSEDDTFKKHAHSHNGVPCSGHSHTHNHGQNHAHTHSHDHSHTHPNLHKSQNLKNEPVKMDRPMLMLAFTCKNCDTRSSHVLSKQAYEDGTVLVQCPGCKKRHLIADHLKIFSDNRITLEDIMKAQGESVTSDTSDLVFEDIPKSLRKLIGHHAKDAPSEYRREETVDEPLKLKGDSEK